MHSIWNFFLQKKQFTYLVIGVIVIFGFFTYGIIPKESNPEIKIPVGIVTVVYPGASASDVEKLITNKIEDGLNGLDNLNKITSSSREGISSVLVEFQSNADPDKSIQKLKDEVTKLKPELPNAAEDPIVSEINFSDQPIFILSVSSDLPATDFVNLANNLKDEIKAVPGVSKVEVSGVRDRQVQVIIDNGRLSNYGLNLTDIASSISAMNTTLPVGDIIIDDIKYSLKFQGDITDTEQVKNIAIQTKTGNIVYLRDIAEVFDGVSDATTFSRFSQNGNPTEQSMTLSIYKKNGGDIINIGNSIKTKVAELQKTLLKDSKVLISFDTSKTIKDDLFHLLKTGIETITLVILLLFLTLGWREALVAALSIPLSFLITFIGLNYSGNTINFISLFSLILAMGILVDSGIVVVESIYTHFKKNGDKELSAKQMIKEYSWPLIAGTLTTAMVFVPLLSLSGVIGKFAVSIPYTIIFVLTASIFVALGLIPAIAVKIIKKTDSEIEEKQDKYFHQLQLWYKNKLGSIIDNKKWQNKFILMLCGGLILSILLPIFSFTKITFIPQSNSTYLYLDIETPKGTSLSQTDLIARAVEEKLYDDSQIESFITTVGSGSNFSRSFGRSTSGSNLANITVNLNKKNKETSTETLEYIKKETSDIKGVVIHISEPSGGPLTGPAVAIKLTGNDINTLNKVALRAEKVLGSIKGTRDVTSSFEESLPDFILSLNRDKAAEFGLNSSSVVQILRNSVYGITATKIRQDGKDIEVSVKTNLNPDGILSGKTNNTTLDSIEQIPINTIKGTILLGSLFDSSLKTGNSVIEHENGKRIITVSSSLYGDSTATEIVGEFMNHKAEVLDGVDNVVISSGGEIAEMTKTFTEMILALVVGMILMLVVLILEFDSFRYAFYTLFIIPLSLTGVLVGLTITGKALSFPVILGIIALAGVIVNHTILLIDSIHRKKHEHPDLSTKEIVVYAASTRIRPILLTTVSTVIGMIPLVFVNEIWGPLALTIMFGLLYSLLLTLFFIPIIVYRWPGKNNNK